MISADDRSYSYGEKEISSCGAGYFCNAYYIPPG